jgi:hypothetical protein
MKFSRRRTYSRHFSFLPFLFVLANRLGSVFCIRQNAEIQKLISEGLTKQPRTTSELKCGEGRRGGVGWGKRAVGEKPHQKTHLPTTMGHLLKPNIANNATQRGRETEEHDNRRTYDCIKKVLVLENNDCQIQVVTQLSINRICIG